MPLLKPFLRFFFQVVLKLLFATRKAVETMVDPMPTPSGDAEAMAEKAVHDIKEVVSEFEDGLHSALYTPTNGNGSNGKKETADTAKTLQNLEADMAELRADLRALTRVLSQLEKPHDPPRS